MVKGSIRAAQKDELEKLGGMRAKAQCFASHKTDQRPVQPALSRWLQPSISRLTAPHHSVPSRYRFLIALWKSEIFAPHGLRNASFAARVFGIDGSAIPVHYESPRKTAGPNLQTVPAISLRKSAVPKARVLGWIVMEIRHLRNFVAIAESGGFVKAASRLHVSQPALSKQIRDLEQELEVTLFQRTTRSVCLTDAGKCFLEDTRELLEQLEQAQTRARRVHNGKMTALTIGLASPYSWHETVTSCISCFRGNHTEVALNIETMMSCNQLAAIRNGTLSAGFVIERPPEYKDMESIVILNDRLLLAVLADSPFAKCPPKKLAELSETNIYAFPKRKNPPAYDKFLRRCQESGLGPRILEEGMNDDANLTFVAAGLGCCFIPSQATWHIPKNVVLVPVGDFDLTVCFELVWRRDNQQVALKQFIETLRGMPKNSNSQTRRAARAAHLT